MSQTSNQLKINRTRGAGNNFRPNNLLAKPLDSDISHKTTDTHNQASYFDETAYFSNGLGFDERDYFAYNKAGADVELGVKNN